MRIIIAGAGEIGFYLSQMLAKESHDIVVIDKNRDILNWVDSHTDVITTCGDSTSIKTLQEAGADRADLLIAVTQLQETNLLIAAIGKQLGAKKTIARVDNSEYLRTDIDVNFEILGIDSLIYPKCLAAQEIDWVLKQATAKSAVEFEDGKLILIEMTIEKDAPIDNKTMVEIGQMNIGLDFRIVAVAHQGKTIIPHGYDKVHEGDRIFIVVNRESTDELINLTGNQKIIIKDIMILGGSRLGVKIAQQLQNYYSVKLIEDDRKKCVELANFLTNTLVLHGDGRDMDFLMEENIDKMDAFIAVTGDSETNMLTCLSVKEKGVKKTIALIENMSYTISSN
ncbi:MAG: Trk system potassium transport protein TrkA [Anaerolineaceae bacterium 4572_78]|nr:MAG: Trk system potassium transport protein TrkA [Anaerolineaceae bacterium 4572_78]